MYNQMAYGKKRPFEPVNQYGFRRKIRRPNMYGRPQKALSYAKFNDQEKKYYVLKDIIPIDLTLDQVGYFTLTVSDIRNCPLMTRVCNTWSKIKLVKFGVKFFQEKGIHGISMVSLDDQDQLTDRDFALRQPTCRVHDFSQDKYPCSRTLSVRDTQHWDDYVETDNASLNAAYGSILRSATGSISSVTAGAKKGCISFAITSAGIAAGNGAAGSAGHTIRIEAQVYFHVMALGMQDTQDNDT